LNRALHTFESRPPPDERPAPDTTKKSAWKLLSRGVRKRCPNCGGRGIFSTYFELEERCPHCGMLLERGEGDYFLGGYALNLIAVELILAGAFLVVLVATWPDPPWQALEYGGVALAVLAPIVCYPFAKGVWLGIDLIFRPPKREDFIERIK